MAQALTDRTSPGEPPEILDVVGVGFGPSNLALAIAVDEYNDGVAPADRLRAVFVERQERFGWHRGMLIEGATMQVSYLKDLVTLRNPTSPYSFLSYLHHNDRLIDFVNYGSAFPTRLEFHDYLEWAAAAFVDRVDYGTEVVEIVPCAVDGVVEYVEVYCRTADGRSRVHRARSVVVAPGLTPKLPQGVSTGERIWHNCELLTRMPELSGTQPSAVAVVGAGQSAAETVEVLHRSFPGAEVNAIFARYGYSPADDTSFANRIFDPGAVDHYYDAPEEVKALLRGYHANTNYSVVDPELIDRLYRTHYHERVAGAERLRFHNVARVADVVDLGDHVELAVESLVDSTRQVLGVDLVVYATGYLPQDPLWLLRSDLAAACARDAAGLPDVARDYRLRTGTIDGAPLRARVYVQGATEHTHGITSTLLSNLAVRSGEIVSSLVSADPPTGRDTTSADPTSAGTAAGSTAGSTARSGAARG